MLINLAAFKDALCNSSVKILIGCYLIKQFYALFRSTKQILIVFQQITQVVNTVTVIADSGKLIGNSITGYPTTINGQVIPLKPTCNISALLNYINNLYWQPIGSRCTAIFN